MRNYFQEASYNTLTIPTSFYPTPTTTVVSYQDSHVRNYFTPYNASTNPTGYRAATRNGGGREHALLKDAVNAVSSQVPAGLNVDGDSDGYVDNVCFVIDGDPTAWATLLWPHMWSLYSYSAYINGKRVYTYNFQLQNAYESEQRRCALPRDVPLAGLARPLSYYTTTASSPPIGGTSWSTNSNPPQAHAAYMKYKYGKWIAAIPRDHLSRDLFAQPADIVDEQLLQDRLAAQRDGVLRRRVPEKDDDLRERPARRGLAGHPHQHELYTAMPMAPRTRSISTGRTGRQQSTGPRAAPISTPRSAGRAINDSTNPSSFLTDGGAGGLSLSGIGAAGSTISFTVAFPYGATRQLSVKATNSGTAISVSPNDNLGNGNGATDFSRVYFDGQTISLTAPATSGSLSFRKWYLDGAAHAATPATTVTMNAAHAAVAVYGVDLGEAVDNTALTWGVEGKGWFGQTSTSYSGGDAAQSAAITHNEKTYVTATVAGPGTLSWYRRTSSEAGYDLACFYVDTTLHDYASGSTGWTLVTVPIPAGVHTLRWSYEKDEGVSSGSDCAWVDLVTYTGTGGRDWQILSGVNPDATIRVNINGTGGDELAGDFGAFGLWLYGGGTWQVLSGVNPDGVVAADVDGSGSQEIAGDFGTTGLWLYGSGAWQILSGVNPDAVIAADLDGNGSQEIVGDFAALGVWRWNSGAWSQLSAVNPEALLAANINGTGGQEVVADFGATGTWLWVGGTWYKISAENPEQMIRANVNADGRDEAYVDYGTSGLWQYDNGTWAQINPGNAEDMIAADVDAVAGEELIVDVGSWLSLWGPSYSWVMLTGYNATKLAAVKTDGDNKACIAANLPSHGVQKWKSGVGWTTMTTAQAEGLGAADTNGDGLRGAGGRLRGHRPVDMVT